MVKKQKREYNARREVNHRIDNIDKIDRLNRKMNGKLIERARSFISMNIAEDKLKLRIKNQEEKKRIADQEIEEAKAQIEYVRKRRKELGYEHEIIVTEHAMLRYLERYEGIDMDDVYKKIIKLPKKDVTKFGNTIVTVYPVDGEEIDDFE